MIILTQLVVQQQGVRIKKVLSDNKLIKMPDGYPQSDVNKTLCPPKACMLTIAMFLVL